MSVTTTTFGRDLPGHAATPIPTSRLVAVELRKMANSRAALWLLIITGALLGLVGLIVVLVGTFSSTAQIAAGDFFTGMSAMTGIFLPILGIMLITQEWGQRTAMVTFSLVPQRGRIIGAKFIAGVIMSVSAVVLAFALTLIGMGILTVTRADVVWNMTWQLAAGFTLMQIISLGIGFVFGALLLNTAAAIVLYFVYNLVVPGMLLIGGNVVDWFGRIEPWINLNVALEPLGQGVFEAVEWGHLTTASIVWVVIPLVLGSWRMLRAEVK